MTSQIVYPADVMSLPLARLYGHCMITDPPYSEHVHTSAVSQAPKKGVLVRDLGFDHLSPDVRRHVAQIAAMCPKWSVI